MFSFFNYLLFKWANSWLFSTNHKLIASLFINKLLVILKLVINIFTLILSIFFGSVIYNILDIKIFVLLLFLILIISNFIIYYKYNILNVSNKYIVLILNKDYTFVLKRIVFIKFILLYLYVVEDLSWCDSSFTRIAHDVFMSMGNKVGIEPKTTVSTLETIGMVSIIGGIAYGSIKGYQHFTGTGPKSINERLDLLERNMAYQNSVTQSKITNLSNKLENTSENLVKLTCDLDKQNIHRFGLVEIAFNNIADKINRIDDKVNDLTVRVEQNQNSINQIIKDEISLKLQRIENLTEAHKNIIERNSENINTIDRNLLQNLYNQVGEIVQEGNKLADNLPKNIPQTNIISSLPKSSISSFRTVSLQKNESIQQAYLKHMKRSNSEHLELEHLPTPTSSTAIVSTLPINKSFKVSEITDNRIVFTSISSEVTNIGSDIVSQITKRVLHIPVNEYVLKIVYNGLGQVLSNTLSGIAFAEILKFLNIGTNVPTTSQNVGSVLSSTLREFVSGLKDGWKK